MIEIWHIWIIVALLLLILEVLTTGFVTICFAIGAFCGALVSYFDGSIKLQLIIFAVTSLLCALLLRPVFVRFLSRKHVETNAESMIGKTATVIEPINNGTGKVSIYGEHWKAVSENNEVIDKGDKVTIININSLILTVRKN